MPDQPLPAPVTRGVTRSGRQSWRADCVWIGGLALLAAIIWIAQAGLWSREAWNVPANYGGDGLQMLGWIKAAAEGDYHLFSVNFVSRLGAPTEANWNDYPMYEKAFTILLGLFARGIGLIAASHLGMLLTHVLATASFFLVCRWFRWDRWWSAAGALLFGFLYYNAWRGLPHLLLGLTYTVPLALLASWLVTSSHRLERFSSAWKYCVVISLLMGLSNPYQLNIYVWFLLLALTIQWFGVRRRHNLETGLLCLAVSAFGFILAHSGSLMFRLFAGKNPGAIVRHYMESEIYALRPIELLVPPPDHRWSLLSSVGERYKAGTYFVGETFSAYLGWVGLIALTLLLGYSLRRLLQQRVREIPVSFWQATWVLVYSVTGGINCWIAFGGVNYFRASNRNSVFIAAIALLWGVSWLSRQTRAWPRPLKVGVAVLAVTAGLLDQLPRPASAEERQEIAQKIENDQKFSARLEAGLPPEAAVFQLPVADFPEGRPVERMEGYEHLRPYLFTSWLRFSYGSNKGRIDPGWQHTVERLPVREMVRQLEDYGFHALLINRAGFGDRAVGFLRILNELGYTRSMEDEAGGLIALLLQPASPPVPLDLSGYFLTSYGLGWRRLDKSAEETLWLQRDVGRFDLRPGLHRSGKLRLQTDIAVPSRREVVVLLDKIELWRKEMDAGQTYAIDVSFAPPASRATLFIRTEGPPLGFENRANMHGTFVLHNLRLSPQPD